MTEKTETKTEAKVPGSKKDKPSQSITSFEDMDNLFDEFLSRNWLSPMHFNWPGKKLVRSTFGAKSPSVDVIDRDKEIIVRAEIPGFDRKDLKVSMTDNTVTIKGKTSKEEKEEKDNYYRREITKGSFSRVVSLPCDVDYEQAKSSFDNGVLELVVPKIKPVKQHEIKI